MLMHFSTWLSPLWDPFSLLDFIASEFCFIWLCNEMFVKWSVFGPKFPCSFSGYGLVTVAWDSSRICLLCAVGIEAVLYDCYESACVMPLLWWLQYIWCVFYDLTALNTACINIVLKTVAWNEASYVVSPVLLMCGSIGSVVMTYTHTYIHAFLQRFALWLSVVDERYGDAVVG